MPGIFASWLALSCATPARLPAAPLPGRADLAPLGIALEGWPYPFPVQFLTRVRQGHTVRMAFMDVAPRGASTGRTVLLLHGRNFPASYWQTTIDALSSAGYRVVAPDQVQFNKSSKLDDVPLHLDDMAADTAALLDALGIPRVDVLAHSMGNLVAVRFGRLFPERAERFIFYGPLGLESYKTLVPEVAFDRLVAAEESVTVAQQMAQFRQIYGSTLPDAMLEPYALLRERLKSSGEWPRWVRSFAASAAVIHDEPVVDDWAQIRQPALFVVGDRDRAAPGAVYAPPEVRARMGRIEDLARHQAATMAHAQVQVFVGAGHLVHLEQPEAFHRAVLSFLAR